MPASGLDDGHGFSVLLRFHRTSSAQETSRTARTTGFVLKRRRKTTKLARLLIQLERAKMPRPLQRSGRASLRAV
jgi:hypothetical protein